jgi:plastocyanin
MNFEGQSIIDMLFELLGQLLIPNWSNLILLLPWVLVVLVAVFLVYTAWQWRGAGARNRPRVAPRVAGAPPVGVHMPGPSRWPFVVPIGAALLLFSLALPPRDATGNPTGAVNVWLFVVGLIVSLIAVAGWLLEAMREWRSTAAGEHAPAMAVALPASTTGKAPTATMDATSALVPAGPTAVVAADEYPEPPPGVHMPGPSPWPFFAPIALAVMLLGLIFSAVLLVGGLILGIIAAAGWLLDAGQEFHSTEAVGHAVPRTRDPRAVWPGRLVPLYGAVIVISLLGMLAPTGIGWLNSLTPPKATPTPIAVPAVPQISASNAVSFDTKLLIVPAGRPFDLVFDNKQAGVPHNVRIDDSSAGTTILFDGEVINGPAQITYHVPVALQAGDYYFLCKIHTNMNGTLRAMPESGGPPAGASPTP